MHKEKITLLLLFYLFAEVYDKALRHKHRSLRLLILSLTSPCG